MHDTALFVWAVSIGLLQGFLHCSGMCGPFVIAFSLSRTSASQIEGKNTFAFISMFVRSHLVHNLGRIFTFVVIGSVFGAVGSFVNAASHLNGIQAVAGMIGGVLMIAWGIDEFRTGHGAAVLEKLSLLRFGVVKRLMRKGAANNPFLSGAILGLHPCGLLFAMLVSAAATGSVWAGGMVLLAFGIGTIPALMIVALLGWYGKKRFTSKVFSYVAATLITCSGILFILRGLAVNGWIPGVNPWLF